MIKKTEQTKTESNVPKILKWVSGGLEALLGFPVIGGAIVLGLFWTPLFAMLVLHIVSLIYSKKHNKNINGHILGIITSCIAWIPIVGMVMHIITAIFLMTQAYKNE